MSSNKSRPHVLILGGGFAGPVLALVLHSRGISSTIYDLRPEGDKQGGNIALAPNALRVLDTVGVFDDVRLAGYNYEYLHLANHNGQELGAFLNGSQKNYNYPAIRVHRRDVRDFLLAKVKSEGIEIQYNKKFNYVVEETDDYVTDAFDDGTEATGDFAVGCDGIHSKVRHYVYPDSEPVFQNMIGMMATVFPDQLTDILGPEGQQVSSRWPVTLPRMTFGDAGMFGTFPADFAGTEFGFMTTQAIGERTREGWAELEHNKDELKDIMEKAFLAEKGGSEYSPDVRTLVQRARSETLSSWPFYVVPDKPTWYSEKGRVIFIGDSAHAIPPTGGQGAAMAFEDAATLALTLSKICYPSPMPDVHTGAPVLGRMELLERWGKHRKERVRLVTDFTSRNGELMKSNSSVVNQMMKEWATWAVLKLQGPGAGAQWLYSYHTESVLAALAS